MNRMNYRLVVHSRLLVSKSPCSGAIDLCKRLKSSPPLRPQPTQQNKNSSSEKEQLPKNFVKFYAISLRKNLPSNLGKKTEIASALELIGNESAVIDKLILAKRRVKRRFWATIFTTFGVVRGLLWLYDHYLQVDQPNGDIFSYNYIVANVVKHVAYYFDSNNKELGSRQFIDYSAFEVSSDSQKDILIEFSTFYPWVPMLLLCLMPLLAIINSKSNLITRVSPSPLAEKTRFRFSRDSNVKTRLTDVAGLNEAKHELTEVIDFLKQPAKYTALGARLPKGVLLDGPPGVGKTLLAKAIAGEAAVPFVSCSGSEFDEVYVGVGASRVRDLFREAHKWKPCVVFIDEIDSFGRQRKSEGQGSSRGTLNAFLSELDGFKDSTGIIVLGATNRADILDNALTRSGRFDRKITLEKPAYKERVAIAMVHLRPLRLCTSTPREGYAECIAALTPGCSGADIYSVCNEAAVGAAREGKEVVTLADFHKAAERVLIGLQKSAVAYEAHEKERLAYHEAGVVVLNWYLQFTDPVIKSTILPRGGHRTGVTQMLPQNIYISTRERLLENITGVLGGYVAEAHFFKDVSARGAEKLEKATEMARQMICVYGMDPASVGHMNFQMDQGAIQKPYGPKKDDKIDQSVEKLLWDCISKAKYLLLQKSSKVQIIASLLMRQESLSALDLWHVLGDRPIMTKEFKTYLLS